MTENNADAPWALDGNEKSWSLLDAAGRRIGLIDKGGKDAAARARLIAQAPAMLAALKLVMEEKAPRYHDCTDDGLPKCAWCFAEEAIAAATGEAHD